MSRGLIRDPPRRALSVDRRTWSAFTQHVLLHSPVAYKKVQTFFLPLTAHTKCNVAFFFTGPRCAVREGFGGWRVVWKAADGQ